MSSATPAPASPPPTPVVGSSRGALSAHDQAILDFERAWAGRPRGKESAIRSQFGLSAARYYQLLHAVIDHPDALVRDPLLVRRLQRIRAARTRARLSRTLGPDLAEQEPHR